jgi:putative FmdB family regulatory protein
VPTYEYKCGHCEHKLEVFQSMSAKPLRKCPECGKLRLRRLIGAGAALLFKGSGFYATDYRSREYQEKAKAESEAESEAVSKTSDGSSKKDG